MGLGAKLLWRAFGLPTGLLGRLGGRILAGGWKGEMVERVAGLLDLSPCESVLEVGFGPGVGIAHMVRRVGERGLVMGVDPSEVMLEMANKRNAEAIDRGTVKLHIGDVERLPFPEGHLDVDETDSPKNVIPSRCHPTAPFRVSGHILYTLAR